MTAVIKEARESARSIRNSRREARDRQRERVRRHLADALEAAEGAALSVADRTALKALVASLSSVAWSSERRVPIRQRRQPKRGLSAIERRLLLFAKDQLFAGRRQASPNADDRALLKRAAEYAFVVLSLNGPALYPATEADLVAVLQRQTPGRRVTQQIDSLRHRT